MNLIKKLFTKNTDELPELPRWVKDAYKKRDDKEADLKAKYLKAVTDFNFDEYSLFSELCKSFRKSFTGEIYMDIHDIGYCEYSLKLSPKTRFTAKRLDGEAKEYKHVWENGISATYFYDPPILIGNILLRPGIWQDNSRVIDCFQLIRTCNKCNGTINSVGRCYGIATIGHHLIYTCNDYHDCPIAKQEYQEELTKRAIEGLVG